MTWSITLFQHLRFSIEAAATDSAVSFGFISWGVSLTGPLLHFNSTTRCRSAGMARGQLLTSTPPGERWDGQQTMSHERRPPYYAMEMAVVIRHEPRVWARRTGSQRTKRGGVEMEGGWRTACGGSVQGCVSECKDVCLFHTVSRCFTRSTVRGKAN